jgi:hypothetical protein
VLPEFWTFKSLEPKKSQKQLFIVADISYL